MIVQSNHNPKIVFFHLSEAYQFSQLFGVDALQDLCLNDSLLEDYQNEFYQCMPKVKC